MKKILRFILGHKILAIIILGAIVVGGYFGYQKLADCYIRAPFDGVVAELNVIRGDSVSSGTTIATMITNQKIAEITLNEIDAVQVKQGQKVTLTFDAVED